MDERGGWGGGRLPNQLVLPHTRTELAPRTRRSTYRGDPTENEVNTWNKWKRSYRCRVSMQYFRYKTSSSYGM